MATCSECSCSSCSKFPPTHNAAVDWPVALPPRPLGDFNVMRPQRDGSSKGPLAFSLCTVCKSFGWLAHIKDQTHRRRMMQKSETNTKVRTESSEQKHLPPSELFKIPSFFTTFQSMSVEVLVSTGRSPVESCDVLFYIYIK